VVMNRRWTVLGVVVPGTALFAWGIHSWVSRAPTYQGKSPAVWFADYARTTNSHGETASLNAMRALGPTAVPVLLNAIQAQDSGLKQFELFIWTRLPLNIKSRLLAPTPAAQRRFKAYVVLAELDPDSDDVLRAMLQGLKDPNQAVRWQCGQWRYGIGNQCTSSTARFQAGNSSADTLARVWSAGDHRFSFTFTFAGVVSSVPSAAVARLRMT